ncbi:MAG: cobalt-precorrin-5B (C(1))-methyltransferase CbiD [Bacteroidales bacterium]|nr:cobalt-precorrin-5B (C(1))-methyltransferase CbiD [Bacteroidales bacterium]
MILVFGGTTEGRKAAATLELAGKPFYYSTKSGEQILQLHHGIPTDGAKDAAAICAFCRQHEIRLLIDAAHPFAEALHRNIFAAACELSLPLVRFDRIYPPHTPDIHWCRNYDDAIVRLRQAGIERLLMLTGVQTIARLQPYWQHHDTWCRILDRDTSRAIAARQGFPAERLVYYEHDDTAGLIARLHPQAIITKESGLSGGFVEKVEAARAAGVGIFVVERPALPPLAGGAHETDTAGSLSSSSSPLPSSVPASSSSSHPFFRIVDGSHGLRRAVEQLLPEFFPLKSGLTTGTCATAAVKAALLALLGEEEEAVWVHLPDGESLLVSVDGVAPGVASVVKDFSDDPDVTRGCRITAHVAFSAVPGSGIRFLQGEGVGRVTLPGLGIPVGEPAINPTPRQMMTAEVRALTDADVEITLSVEHGRQLAERTFNARVGVVDGISIIGTSGIVHPLSNEAFVESIGRELQVARAMGCDAVGLASGKRGEEALLALEPSLRVIHYGNFIGETLARAHALGFRRAVLGIMIGKAVKLAEGHLDTHSHKVLMNTRFLTDVAATVGVADAASRLHGLTMARELWSLMPPAFFDRIQTLCLHHCRTVFPTGNLEVHLIKD